MMEGRSKNSEEPQKKFGRKIESFADTYLSPVAKVGAYFLIGTPMIILALFGGLWWLDKATSWAQGFLPILLLWVFVFNDLPKSGFKCLKAPANIYFLLPLSILASSGFVIGYLFRSSP